MFFLFIWKGTFGMITLLEVLFKILRIHPSMSKLCFFLTVSSYHNTEAQDSALCLLFLKRNYIQSFSGLMRGSEGFVFCSAWLEKKNHGTFHLLGACFMFWSWSQIIFLKSESETFFATHQARVTQGFSPSLWLCVTIKPIQDLTILMIFEVNF